MIQTKEKCAVFFNHEERFQWWLNDMLTRRVTEETPSFKSCRNPIQTIVAFFSGLIIYCFKIMTFSETDCKRNFWFIVNFSSDKPWVIIWKTAISRNRDTNWWIIYYRWMREIVFPPSVFIDWGVFRFFWGKCSLQFSKKNSGSRLSWI